MSEWGYRAAVLAVRDKLLDKFGPGLTTGLAIDAINQSVAEIERLQARVVELEADIRDAAKCIVSLGGNFGDALARDQRREQMLRECLSALSTPDVMAATWMEESRIRARLRAELGEK